MDIRQAEVTAGVAVGEALVVDAEEMQDGCVETVDMDAVFLGVHSELVCTSVHEAP